MGKSFKEQSPPPEVERWWATESRCPRCGARLRTNGELITCPNKKVCKFTDLVSYHRHARHD